jgi:hypothetical protein
MLVQVLALSDTWIWNALPAAVSQFSSTRVIARELPRSTCNHCGSLKADAQRVPVLPSTASAAA